MKSIIDGRIYDTSTAEKVCEFQFGWRGDSSHHESTLYRTKRGTFFLAGSGGPRSMWAIQQGNTSSAGSGLRVIDAEEARMHMEAAHCLEHTYGAVGLALEEG